MLKILSFLIILQVTSALARSHHMDLEMTGKEYLRLLEANPTYKMVTDAEDLELQAFLEFGKRNLEWVDFINQARPLGSKLSLTSRATQAGNPVSGPRVYNFKVIKDRWSILRALVPETVREIVFNQGPYQARPGLTERELVEWLFQIDQAYQLAARYRMNRPKKHLLAQRISTDVRGYLELRDDPDLDSKLRAWATIGPSKQDYLKRHLLLLCLNSGRSRFECAKKFEAAVLEANVLGFKTAHWKAGEKNYQSFFSLWGSRTDHTWSVLDEKNMYFPFTHPGSPEVHRFLEDNIEAEWQWDGWRLNLDFLRTSDPQVSRVVFEPGVTPHVNWLFGTVIYLDANAPLTEYDVQWTIRHEFGHLLGFPDCYHEFYDEELEAFVSYQLDVTNLMCSRRGKLKETHFIQLKKFYYREEAPEDGAGF